MKSRQRGGGEFAGGARAVAPGRLYKQRQGGRRHQAHLVLPPRRSVTHPRTLPLLVVVLFFVFVRISPAVALLLSSPWLSRARLPISPAAVSTTKSTSALSTHPLLFVAPRSLSPRATRSRSHPARFFRVSTATASVPAARSLSARGASSSSDAASSTTPSPSRSTTTRPASLKSAVKRSVASLWGRAVGWAKKVEGKVRQDRAQAPVDDDDGRDRDSARDLDDGSSFRSRRLIGDDDEVEDVDDVRPVRIENDSPLVLTSSSFSASNLLPLPSLLAPPSSSGQPPTSSPVPQVASSSSSSSPLGGVVGVMGQLDAFRGAQRAGAQTSQLLMELQNQMQVDASSYGNHVKVIMDGRQRVKAVEFDETFLKTSEPYEVSAAVLEALQLAHEKSVDKMDEKVKAFYNKLGWFGGGGGWMS